MSKKMILTFMGITGFAAGHLPVFNTDQESVKTLIVSLRCASESVLTAQSLVYLAVSLSSICGLICLAVACWAICDRAPPLRQKAVWRGWLRRMAVDWRHATVSLLCVHLVALSQKRHSRINMLPTEVDSYRSAEHH